MDGKKVIGGRGGMSGRIWYARDINDRRETTKQNPAERTANQSVLE